MQDGEIQWFQILNSLVIVLFMSGMIAMILLRTLHRDIARYNQENVVRHYSYITYYLVQMCGLQIGWCWLVPLTSPKMMPEH